MLIGRSAADRAADSRVAAGSRLTPGLDADGPGPRRGRVVELLARGVIHEEAWIAARLDDSVRELRAAQGREVLDVAEAVGFLGTQAVSLDLCDAEVLDRAVAAALRLAGAGATAEAAVQAGRRRAEAHPWRVPGTDEHEVARPGTDDVGQTDTERDDVGQTDTEDAEPSPEDRERLRLLSEVAEQRRRRDAMRLLAAEDTPPLRWLSFADFRASPRPSPLVPGVLYRDSLARIFGAPGCGKSFLAIDLACHVALGRSWRDEDVEPTPVVYVMAEGQAVNVLRVDAWCERHRVDPAALEGRLYAVPDAVVLTEEGVRELAAKIAEVRAGLVILDTKNAMMVGEENSASDTAVMRRALDVLRKASDACVVLIDHAGHEGTRARGSSAATAAMDTEVRVTRSDDTPVTVSAEVTRDKAAEAGRSWRWYLRMAGDAAVLAPTELDGTEDIDRGKPDWREADDVVVPTELLDYEGKGAKVMLTLARFLAHDASPKHGDLEGIGVSRTEAVAAMKGEGFEPTGVRRAWSALIAKGFLDRADKVKNDTGRHVWTS